MATDLPLVEDLTILGGAAQRLGGMRVVDYTHTDASEAPWTGVATATFTWKFRRSAESDVVLVDASSGVTVLDAAQGWIQMELTAVQTAALTGVGVFDLAMDDVVLWRGRWAATPRVSR